MDKKDSDKIKGLWNYTYIIIVLQGSAFFVESFPFF